MSKPSDFTKRVWGSVFQSTEHEIVFRNIMIIKERTGDEWGLMSWETYKSERLKDGPLFGDSASGTKYEEEVFPEVVPYTVSAEQACRFS